MEAVVELLNATLDFHRARDAEQQLRRQESQPGFSLTLLRITAEPRLPQATRQAAAVFFKNLVRRLWTDEEGSHLLPAQDVIAIKSELIDLMISLPPRLQAQLGEAVAVIADSDFPEQWQELVPTLVSRLSTDPTVNNGVLTVAHAIFKRWRPLFRSDELFLEIKLVLDQFAAPYLQLMAETNKQIQETGSIGWLQTMSLLVKLFYDLNCQDIPEFFEDHISEFMHILGVYLVYENPSAESDDENEAGVLEDIRAGICEILQLYTERYEEEFLSQLPGFVEMCWTLLTHLGPEPKYDLVVNRALAFLSSVAKRPHHLKMFANDEVLRQLVEKIVIPNMTMRESDVEMFEDEPIEYTRRDLEGSDSDTRRRAATDFLRELATNMEAQVTQCVMRYVEDYLEKARTTGDWHYKNTASHLFQSIAAKGNVTSVGVSTTNLLIDVVGFFNRSIAPDLVNPNVPPILQVDAIKFIHNFRNQLTKEQLSEALPLLATLLTSTNPVTYTYAAVTIERILSIRAMFTEDDIKSEISSLTSNLMSLILKNADTPQKLAENEYLIKCVMRVLVVSQASCSIVAPKLLPQLVEILQVIATNPSNPRFSHYLFECIGALVKYSGSKLGYSMLDTSFVQPGLQILAQDVTEFIPYILQIFAEILALQQVGLPQSYQQLVKPLLAPVLWEPKGNIPALVGLLKVVLVKGAETFIDQGLLQPLLGVFQNLIASRANDILGLDIMKYIFLFIPFVSVAPYMSQIAGLLLVRLQQSRTDKFVVGFAEFMLYLSAAELSSELGPEFSIQFIDQVQPNLFGQILKPFILDAATKIVSPDSRRIATIGLIKLLRSPSMVPGGPYHSFASQTREVVEAMISTNVAEKHEELVVDVDLEELSFGASFSKLSTATVKEIDPVPSIQNAAVFYQS